jgi:hypothetical protein
MSNQPPEMRAPEAARTVHMGLTAFNELRDQLTRQLDPKTGTLDDPPTSAEQARKVILVAPALGGYRRPGSDWRYSRIQVERYAAVGLAGVGQEAKRWVSSLVGSLIGESPIVRSSSKARAADRNVAKPCEMES